MQTEALRANLERTAVDVEIPADHEVLLEISEPMFGVHRDTERLLREIHHEYVGWLDTLPELHRRAMNDVYLYTRHERAVDGLSVYGELYAKAAAEASPSDLREDAVRWWLAFLSKVVEEAEDQGIAEAVVMDSVAELGALVEASPLVAAAASGRLKRLTGLLRESGMVNASAATEAVTRSALAQVFRLWLERDDPAEWFQQLDVAGDLPEVVTEISHAALRDSLSAVGDATSDPARLFDHGSIVRRYLEAADTLEGELDARTRWLCLVLGEPLLEPIHERALWTLARFCNNLVAGADRSQFEEFIDEVFSALRAAGDAYGSAHLDLVRRIGMAVLGGPRPAWSDIVIDEILTLDFHRPDFAGFTDDWSVRVNPNHLKNIRTYLDIIGANPPAAAKLLAALVIHLDAGGVFIADTDLFQKDVSALLASDIAPVYHQVRSLLRRLPVYFSDIGAEGALRDVSTRIDEIRARRDPLCHFLRKQCHVESNPNLIELTEAVGRFWATGEVEAVRAVVPEELHSALDIDSELYTGLHRVFSELDASDRGLDGLFGAPLEEVEALIDSVDAAPVDLDKARLLFRLRAELARKYSLDHSDLIERLRASNRFERGAVDALVRDLDADRFGPAIERLLGMLGDLRAVILSTDEMEIIEDIYRKRHIGTGIPSMYGSYREARLDAVGMSFRIESLVGALIDRVAMHTPADQLDHAGLDTTNQILKWLAVGLDVEGYRSQGLEMSLSMLDDALHLPGVTRGELADAARGVTHSVHVIVRNRVLLVYGDLFEQLGSRALPESSSEKGTAESVRASEAFLRNLIAESMSLQRIDNLSAVLLHALSDVSRSWDYQSPSLSTPPVDVVRIDETEGGPGPMYLGNKAALLGRLADLGFPIPRGFVIPTGIARTWGGDRSAALPDRLVTQIKDEIKRLERASGARFGDAHRPLLLSVRGGAPISMPGMLNSFLNVGINPEIAEGVAARSGSAWAAWDAYRRFLQFWGMSRGMDRDVFDELMSSAKSRFSAEKKAMLTSDQMAELTMDYRALVADSGIEIVDDPMTQLLSCVALVIGSWDSAMARVYRGEVGIADGWGTAVIIQTMVYGNLHDRSGTGVLLTHHPGSDARSFELYGDFVIQGQGDDVVSGLVDTFPISERQRYEEPVDAGGSLEYDFPEIYAELDRIGRVLVEEHGWSHQEIEFTFEGEHAADLYLLQTREAVADEIVDVPLFRSTSALSESRLAVGIGVSGGAVSCRVAQNESDIVKLRFEHPDDPVLLVRPDTVPDDIHLLLQADALLTAIGGATSHAAVVAKRLGKTCVVGCRQLRVFEAERRIEIAGRELLPGEWVSISGADGSVYLGRHEVERSDAGRGRHGIGGVE